MKQKSKLLLVSAASIAMCSTLIVGSTYALFTSETKTDISVHSGTVSIKASLSELTLYSYGTNGAVDAFTNGGTATYDAKANKLTLERITPGDKVTFNIVVENSSNVTMKYRSVSQVVEDTGLYSGLVVTMQSDVSNAVNGAALNWTPWREIASASDGATTTIETVAVTIELPYLEEDQNRYQNKTCALSFTVEAVQGNADVTDATLTVGGGFEVEQTADGGVELTALPAVSQDGVVEIPVGVTDLGRALWFNDEIQKVVLPSTVTEIGGNSFSYCDSLEEVVIPDSVTSIGSRAFGSCPSLKKVVIPDSVTEIGASAFYGCESLEEIVIPESVTTLEYGTFNDCTSLKSVTLPETLTVIEQDAFKNCGALEEVNVPEGVTTIGEQAFYGCQSITEITLPASVDTLGRNAFRNCTSLETVEFNAQLTEVPMYTFSGCSSLSSIEFPNSVTSVGQNAFENCSSLETVVLPTTVTTLKSNAFSGCSSLEGVALENVTTIETSAFKGCSSLEEVTLSDEIKTINSCVFQDCTSLAEVDFPEQLTTISSCAFQNTGLTSVTIPESVTKVDSSAFVNSKNLSEFVLDEDSTATLGWSFVQNTSVKTLVVPENVKFTDQAFRGIYTLENIIFKGKVDSFANFLFAASGGSAHLTITLEKNTALPSIKPSATATKTFFMRNEVTIVMPNYTGTETTKVVGEAYSYANDYGYDGWTTLNIKTSAV